MGLRSHGKSEARAPRNGSSDYDKQNGGDKPIDLSVTDCSPAPLDNDDSEDNITYPDFSMAENTKLNMQKSRRNQYLLQQTELFRHFISYKESLECGKEYIPESITTIKPSSRSTAAKEKRKHDHLDDVVDPDLVVDPAGDVFRFSSTPPYIKNGKMRDYQIQGLNWLISLYHNDINGILADEMGLGKTLQSLSFLGYLKHFRNISGPHMIIAPKSTLDSWHREILHWVPDINLLLFYGNKIERSELIKNRIKSVDFEVLITSYEICLIEKSTFRKIHWKYIIIDEAHRIKNENSLLSQIVRVFPSSNRLLLTGTPLQNNLHELWSLLNFLLPDVFSSSQVFDDWFSSESGGSDKDEIVQQLRRLLNPFLLRRLKIDVERSLLPKKEIYLYVSLSELQRQWYQKILERDIDAVNGSLVGSSKKEGKTRLQNIVMQLRKCANHPYLFDGAEPGPPFTTDQHLIDASGKLIVLDSLLARLKTAGSRVLLFSQMSRVLDILEDFCFIRKYNYCRLDGQTSIEDRIQAIDEFNRPDSGKFLFLLTTRAGGLGINLTSADIVILFDSDWNPQVDLQAQDRAHRIGQKKQVVVFRFITENTLEEKILERSIQKLRLDQLVIQQGKQTGNNALSHEDMLAMIRFGVQDIIGKKKSATKGVQSQADNILLIEDLIRKGEKRTLALQNKYKDSGLEDLQRFSTISTREDGTGAAGIPIKSNKSHLYVPVIPLSKRERKSTFAEGGLYGDSSAILPRGVKAFGTSPSVHYRKRRVYPFQFYPDRVQELLNKELAFFGCRPTRPAISEDTDDDEYVDPEDAALDDSNSESEEIHKDPLTIQENEELETLLESTGFPEWTKKEFNLFIKACERNGRHALDNIALDMMETSKTFDQIKRYSEIFWKSYKSIPGYEKILSGIRRGETKLARLNDIQEQLTYFFEHFIDPPSTLFKENSLYTENDDLFLLKTYHNLGGSVADFTFERVKECIRLSPHYRFDWFMKTRSSLDLSRRITTYLLPEVMTWVSRHQQELTAQDKNKKKKNVSSEKEETHLRRKSRITSSIERSPVSPIQLPSDTSDLKEFPVSTRRTSTRTARPLPKRNRVSERRHINPPVHYIP